MEAKSNRSIKVIIRLCNNTDDVDILKRLALLFDEILYELPAGTPIITETLTPGIKIKKH